jgi:hypothetical protein
MSIDRLHEYARILKICAAADPQSKGTNGCHRLPGINRLRVTANSPIRLRNRRPHFQQDWGIGHRPGSLGTPRQKSDAHRHKD